MEADSIEYSAENVDGLFRQFLSGDDHAFKAFFREMNPRLSAYCYKLVPAAWEDVVQEVWERTIRLRGRKDMVIQSPVSFIFRIAKNLCMDHYRVQTFDVPLVEETLQIPSAGEGSLEWLVTESLERLSFEDREVLVLNVYSGYTLGEIAEMQTKSKDAIWARASRARMRLRKIVEIEAKRYGISLPGAKHVTNVSVIIE